MWTYFTELNLISVLFRLFLSMMLAGLLGMERSSREKPAGFRTYMMVSIGAALTMILCQYEDRIISTLWEDLALETGVKIDAARFGAQVINGIGFLGAGSIIVSKKNRINGVDTASALWASATVGLAIGAGFYFGALVCFALIYVTMIPMRHLRNWIRESTRNLNLYIEFQGVGCIREMIRSLRREEVEIFGMEIEHRKNDQPGRTSWAVFYLKLPNHMRHVDLISLISRTEDIYTVDEV